MDDTVDEINDTFTQSVTVAPSGLKNFLHGNVYQLKLLLLNLLDACSREPNFQLKTEIKGFGNFDDMIHIIIEKNGKRNVWFLQAKHSQDDEKTIVFKDLISKKSNDGNFYLLTYFCSYLTIIGNEFKPEEIENFYICTNMNADVADFNQKVGNLLLFNHKTNPFLYLMKKENSCYTIPKKASEHIFGHLNILTPLRQLAADLMQYIVEKKPLDFSVESFKRYHLALKDDHIIKWCGEKRAEFHSIFSYPVDKTVYEFDVEKRPRNETFKRLFMEEFKKEGWKTEKFRVSELLAAPPIKVKMEYNETEDAQNLNEIAKNFARNILNGEEVQIAVYYPDKYINMLKQSVLDISVQRQAEFRKTFKTSFLKGLAGEFQKLFILQYSLQFTEEHFYHKIQHIKMETVPNFGHLLQEHQDELENVEKFTKYITGKINDFKRTHITVSLKNVPCYGKNFEKLAGKNRAIVFDEDQENVVSGKSGTILKFSYAFVHNNENIAYTPRNLRSFRKRLTFTINDLENFRFTIPKHCTEFDVTAERTLSEDEESDENKDKSKLQLFNNFLEKLVLAVDQPDENELDTIIKNELTKNFEKLYIDFVYNSLFVIIQNWVKKKTPSSYTKDEFKAILKDLQKEIIVQKVMASTVEYCKLLKRNCNSSNVFIRLNDEVVNFLKSENKIIGLHNDNSALFLAIQVLETLQNVAYLKENEVNENYYDAGYSYLFNTLESMVATDCSKMELFSNSVTYTAIDFSKNIKLVVIVIEKEIQMNLDDVQKSLNELLFKKPDLKIILISLNNCNLAKMFYVNEWFEKHYCHIEQNDFTDDAKHFLLSKLEFQDKTFIMEQNNKELLDFIDVGILQNDKIKIGNGFVTHISDKKVIECRYNNIIDIPLLDFVETFKNDIFVFETNNKQFVLNCGIEDEQIHNSHDLNFSSLEIAMKAARQNEESHKKGQIVLIPPSEDHFSKFCAYFKNFNIHFFKTEAGQLAWQKSHNSIKNLFNYMSIIKAKNRESLKHKNDAEDLLPLNITKTFSNTIFSQTELFNRTVDEKVVIVSATNAFVTETLANNLKDNYPDFWIFTINLSQFCTKFNQKWQSDKRLEKLSNALFHFSIFPLLEDEIENDYEKKIFKHFYESRKVIAVVDGICEFHKTSNVHNCLKQLKFAPFKQVWIVTKPKMALSFEIYMKTFSYKLYVRDNVVENCDE